MKNLFEQASSYWVRYDRYELKEGTDGVLYVTVAPDATPKVYNPLENPEQLVLDALNVPFDRRPTLRGGLGGNWDQLMVFSSKVPPP